LEEGTGTRTVTKALAISG